MNFPNWPFFEEDEITAVQKVLLSGKVNYWTGNIGRLFEKNFSDFSSCKYSVAVANGSLALTAAYMSLGLSFGDEIITTSRTFIATSSTALLLGIKPVFADLDYLSGNINAKTIEPLITKKTKAIAVVHIAGWPADMYNILKLARKYNLKILEDCSQAHGAKIDGRSVGSFGDVATWSFCQDKIISTGGEGGIITTNNEDIFDFLFSIKDHGKSLKSIEKYKNKEGFKWVHDRLGNNFRLTEIQSQIGLIQLSKLENWVDLRNRNANILIQTLFDINTIRVPVPEDNIKHAYYKFYFFLAQNKSVTEIKDKIIKDIKDKGFPAFHGGCSEIYLEKVFRDLNLGPKKRLPIAKELGETGIMLLVHPSINEVTMYNYASVVRKSILKFT